MRRSIRYLFLMVLLSAFSFQLLPEECSAFFVGFGSVGGADNVVKQGQDAGLIPLTPGKGLPGPGEKTNAETAWVNMYDGGSQDYGRGIAVDPSGSAYVTGYSYHGSNNDCLTIKYDTNGNKVWQKAYDSGNDDRGYSIAVDDTGNVYVAGSSFNTAPNNDCLTIKYDINGNTVWQKIYDSGSHDYGYGIAVDDTGNVYVAGTSDFGGLNNYLIIKYDSSGNTAIWQKAYDGGNDDRGYSIAVDDTGNVYVAGRSLYGMGSDYLTVKFNPDGDTEWSMTYNGGSLNKSEAHGIAVDDTGNVYVTGYSTDNITVFYDCTTIKYDTNGNTVWLKTHHNYQGYGIAVDASSYAYATGCVFGGFYKGYFIIKYDPGGDTMDQKIHNTGGGQEGKGIAIDPAGNVYVAGVFTGISNDYLTVKYRPY